MGGIEGISRPYPATYPPPTPGGYLWDASPEVRGVLGGLTGQVTGTFFHLDRVADRFVFARKCGGRRVI